MLLDALDDDVDLVLFNLEGPICSNVKLTSHAPKAGPRICSTFDIFENFKAEGRRVIASVANNHFWDFGPEGVESTLRRADESDCALVGHSESSVVVGSDWVVLSFTEPTFGSESLGGNLSILGPGAFAKVSDFSRKGIKVIVLVHGGTEDCFLISPRSVQNYRALCDLGASVVWATQSHVPQCYEVYGESFICYGAGNSLIDLDRWSEYEFGAMSRSMVLESLAGEIRYEAFLTQQISESGRNRLIRVTNDSVVSSINNRDSVSKRLIDDRQLHEKVWIKYAERWFDRYGFGAYMRGAVIDLLNRYRFDSLFSKMRYPLSLDNFLWPANHELILTGLAVRYGLLEVDDDPGLETFIAELT